MVAQGVRDDAERGPGQTRAAHAHAVITPRSQRSIEQISAGLAAIAIQPSLRQIYGEAVALLARLPAVGTVAVVRRDDHGLLALTQQTGTPVPEALVEAATSAIHQQWIASHARDGEVTGPAPFALPGRDDVLLVPMVSGDALIGGFVLVGKSGIPPAVGSAERVSAAAIGTVTAQAIDNLLARQRAAVAVSQLEQEAVQMSLRKSLGRELHDGPTQELALAGITLDRLVRHLGADQPIFGRCPAGPRSDRQGRIGDAGHYRQDPHRTDSRAECDRSLAGAGGGNGADVAEHGTRYQRGLRCPAGAAG